jgi:hypothetical protein
MPSSSWRRIPGLVLVAGRVVLGCSGALLLLGSVAIAGSPGWHCCSETELACLLEECSCPIVQPNRYLSSADCLRGRLCDLEHSSPSLLLLALRASPGERVAQRLNGPQIFLLSLVGYGSRLYLALQMRHAERELRLRLGGSCCAGVVAKGVA